MAMELSVSPSPCIFSQKRPHQIASSSHQTKITTRIAAKFVRPSSNHSQILPSNIFYNRKGCSKLAPNEFHCTKAILVRDSYMKVASKQAHADGGVVKPESEPKNTANIIYALRQFIRPPVVHRAHTGSESTLKVRSNFWKGLWQFVRPPIMLSILLEFCCILARSWMENSHLLKGPRLPGLIIKAIGALLVLECCQLSVNCINQVYDIEIDKINKPHFPLASGDLSLEFGWMFIVGATAVCFLVANVMNSGPLVAAVFCMFILGIMYTVPPLRIKASTFGAPFSISLTTSFVPIFSMFASTRAVLGLPFQLSLPQVVFLIIMTLYGITCGIVKDLPDLEGDTKNGIPTLASVVGTRRVVFLILGILSINYIGFILAAIYMPKAFKPSIVIPAHIVMPLILVNQGWKLANSECNKEQSLAFNRLMYVLYQAEFLMFPFI